MNTGDLVLTVESTKSDIVQSSRSAQHFEENVGRQLSPLIHRRPTMTRAAPSYMNVIGLGTLHVAGGDALHPEPGSLDKLSDRPIEMAPATDALPKRREAILPPTDAGIGREAMFDEQEDGRPSLARGGFRSVRQ